jgi:hypothetical protein
MQRKLMHIAAIVGWCLVGSGVLADGHGRRGIAFATAPEQAEGVCIGDDADEALACARRECAAQGPDVQDCGPVALCFPMGWSADLLVEHAEGLHWHEYLCGWPTREKLIAAVNLRCDLTDHEYLVDCRPVRFWTDRGEALAVPE